MGFPSVPIAAIRAYHAEERHLFSRMALDLSIDPARSMEIIAFWLWLEENGHADIIHRINSLDDDALRGVAAVGRTFVDALRLEPTPPPDHAVLPPNLRLRQAAIRGISYYLHSVCYKAFDDIRQKAEEREAEVRRIELLVHQMSRAYLDHVGRRSDRRNPTGAAKPFVGRRPYVPHGEGTSTRGGGRRKDPHVQGGWVAPSLVEMEREILAGCHLEMQRLIGGCTGMLGARMDRGMLAAADPDGEPPYYLTGQDSLGAAHRNVDVPRDERTLFVTFSNGYPLTEEELCSFFMRRYGDVEVVNVQHVTGEGHALFAHVSFYSLATVLRILNGNVKVKFMTNGKHLWARRFIPKREL